jgi:enterochelin esterase-like enzyme
MRLGPDVDLETGEVVFTAAEHEGGRPLRVWYHLRDFGDDPTFRADGAVWAARVPRPPVDRMEYLLTLRAPDGSEPMVLDPDNAETVPGVFGDHSELLLPGYQRPEWIGTASPPWAAEPLKVDTEVAGVVVHGELLTPPEASQSDVLPLLVVHDGPEYVRLARLLDYLGWLTTQRESLLCRVLALQPEDRNLSYAASPEYTEALVRLAVPLARTMAPSIGPAVGLGASLGALALAHASATHPGAFGGLFLQSGSFFRPEFDAHERRFRYFHRVVAATTQLHAQPSSLSGVVIRLTAGTGEENLDNNRALVTRLSTSGLDARITEGRDGHNYVAWRDLLHPGLADLLLEVWG